MHATRFARLVVATSLAAWLVLLAAAAQAQVEFDINGLDESPDAAVAPANAPVKVQAAFVLADGKTPARLMVTAVIERKWHINSQAKIGDNIPTKIEVVGGSNFKLTGEFTPDKPAKPHHDDGIESEQHEGTVTWTAPIEIAAGVDPAKLSIDGTFRYQACSSSCLAPITAVFTAKLADGAAPEPAKDAATGVEVYRGPLSQAVEWTGHIEPKAVSPGSKFKLVLVAKVEPHWHIYPRANLHTSPQARPTVIALTDADGFEVGPVTVDGKLESVKIVDTEAKGTDSYYEQRVVWTTELTAPKDLKSGLHSIRGAIGYMACKDGQCTPPVAANFAVDLPVAEASVAGALPLLFSSSKQSYFDVVDAAASGGFDADKVQAFASAGSQSILLMLGAALLGGLILNAMPCVLPVIGLKILGFVEQSHDHRSRVFMLNMWFSLGLISVFLVLASLAVFLGMGWGAQFTKPWFVIGMVGLVFSMALSFLGVWEIPIPGFVGSGGAQQLASREGASGAFAKGVFTTLLATPCSGPFLGPLFGLLLRESPAVIYAVFTCVGLGMASPYLLIGAFPQLIRMLPRPGAWMDTMKQFMAFVLLGTVVFLFMSIKQDYFIPTFAMLIGLWLGCWWIGRTPLTAELGTKLISWGSGAAMAAVIGWFSFAFLTPGKELLDWKPYSKQALVQLTNERKTVFIDFTAEWCLTCKRNERMAINTEPVKQLVDELGIVTLKADWTDGSPDIEKMLKLLGSNSIPVYAIFPADRPNEPIVLRDLVTQKQILETLRKAGKSQTTAEAPKIVEKTAMNP
jgi:suppressor for copper-sensitivity B